LIEGEFEMMWLDARRLRSENVPVRSKAMASLQETASNALLLESLASQYDDVRIWAVNGLASRGAPEAVTAIITAAQDRSCAVRDAAIGALRSLRDPSGRAPLSDLLPLKAIVALGRLRDKRAFPSLAAIITNKKLDHFLRVDAANALRAADEPTCIDSLISILPEAQHHGRSGDWARSMLLNTGPSAIDPLIRAMSMGDLTARLAAGVLIDMGNNRAIQAAADALRTHPDSQLRASIAMHLGSWKPASPAAAEILMPAVLGALQDEHVGVRNSAARILSNIAPDPSLLLSGVLQGRLHLTSSLVKYFAKARYVPAIEPIWVEISKAGEESTCEELLRAVREILEYGNQHADPKLLERITQMVDPELSVADYDLSIWRTVKIDCSSLRMLAQQRLSQLPK
jgi:HEAT repeat protein